jgi:hypothetical protein
MLNPNSQYSRRRLRKFWVNSPRMHYLAADSLGSLSPYALSRCRLSGFALPVCTVSLPTLWVRSGIGIRANILGFVLPSSIVDFGDYLALYASV